MKNITDVKVFSSVYIERLHRNLISTQDYSNYTKDKFPFEEIFPKGQTGITISDQFALDSSKDDLYNSIQIYEQLSELNEIQASDERLWTYFTLNLGWEYMRKRWPAEKVDEPINRIRDRYFLRTMKLETLTRNGISRLWWYAHLTYDKSLQNKYELTEILLKRADLAVGITERALGCNKNIRIGLLEFLRENPHILDSEEKSRKLLVDLQLVGGVKNLPFLRKDDVKSILKKVA